MFSFARTKSTAESAVMQTVDSGTVPPKSDFCIAQCQILLAPKLTLVDAVE